MSGVIGYVNFGLGILRWFVGGVFSLYNFYVIFVMSGER